MNLGYRQSVKPPTRIDAERVKRNGFHDDRILVVSIDDPRLAWPDRMLLQQIGERLYGRRENGRHR